MIVYPFKKLNKMSLIRPSLDEVQQIMQLQHVENCESLTGFYFNIGTVERVSSLIVELKRAHLDPTVLCFAPPHDPQNVYYTPKNPAIKLTSKGWEIKA